MYKEERKYKDRKTERQRDRETERQTDMFSHPTRSDMLMEEGNNINLQTMTNNTYNLDV